MIRGDRRRRDDASDDARGVGLQRAHVRQARRCASRVGEPARLRRRALDAEQAPLRMARRARRRNAPSPLPISISTGASRPKTVRQNADPAVRSAGRGSAARQSERTLADDVALHLRRAAADRERARGEDAPQPLARRRRSRRARARPGPRAPADRSRAHDAEVQLGAEELRDRRFGTGLATRRACVTCRYWV